LIQDNDDDYDDDDDDGDNNDDDDDADDDDDDNDDDDDDDDEDDDADDDADDDDDDDDDDDNDDEDDDDDDDDDDDNHDDDDGDGEFEDDGGRGADDELTLNELLSSLFSPQKVAFNFFPVSRHSLNEASLKYNSHKLLSVLRSSSMPLFSWFKDSFNSSIALPLSSLRIASKASALNVRWKNKAGRISTW